MNLGKLIKIESLRSIWPHEAIDFTKWLIRPENLQLLSESIGINIKVTETEVWSGDFKVDIKGIQEETGKILIIENQLEKTNHDHLGKIVTYAAGHEAEIIIWIVKDFRDEHKQALDWLNEHTDDKVNFFGINIELWKIDESKCAPKFNIFSEPNEWKKTLKLTSDKRELSENSIKLLNFIDTFISYCKERGTTLNLGRPQPATPAYYTIGIRTVEGWINVKLNNSRKVAKVEFYFKEKELYIILKSNYKAIISKWFESSVNWDDMEKNKGSQFGVSGPFDLEAAASWPTYFEWIKVNAETLQQNLPKLLSEAKVGKY